MYSKALRTLNCFKLIATTQLQIRQALSAVETGNTFAFATGKAARQKEKEMAAQFREGLKVGSTNVVETGGGATLKVSSYMHVSMYLQNVLLKHTMMHRNAVLKSFVHAG